MNPREIDWKNVSHVTRNTISFEGDEPKSQISFSSIRPSPALKGTARTLDLKLPDTNPPTNTDQVLSTSDSLTEFSPKYSHYISKQIFNMLSQPISKTTNFISCYSVRHVHAFGLCDLHINSKFLNLLTIYHLSKMINCCGPGKGH